MKTTIIRLPDPLHKALVGRGKNLNAVICSLLAESLNVDYAPPKRGGRRVPKLTAEELAKANAATSQPIAHTTPKQPPAVTPQAAPKQPITPSALSQVKAVASHRQTMAERGEHYAQIRPGGHFTGRTSSKEDVPLIAGRIHPQWVFVGDMLYEEFEKRVKG